MICKNIGVENGILTFAGVPTPELISEFGSPLYVMDEQRIRENCRTYADAMKKYFGGDSCALYASKAASFKKMYKIVADEGLGADVVSCGEIYTAMKAGFPLEKAYFEKLRFSSGSFSQRYFRYKPASFASSRYILSFVAS